MRIKVDEDLPNAAIDMLQSQGHDAVSVVEQGMGGWKDPALWRIVQAEERFLVTADKGFADIRSHAPGTHVGVLLLRPNQDGIRPILELLEMVLASYDLEALTRAVTVVSPRSIRVRHASI